MKKIWRFWPLRITLIYFLLSSLWIVLSDSFLNRITQSTQALSLWQTYKGIIFVTASSLLILLLTLAEQNKRQKALQELEHSRNGFTALFSNNPQPMWVYEQETARFLAVNDAAVARYGYSAEEFLGMTLYDIRPPGEADRLRDDLSQQRPRLQDSGVWRHKSKDGRVFPVQITSHTIEFAKRAAVLVVSRDVSGEMQTLEELEQTRREQAELQTIINRSPVVVIRWKNSPGWPIELVSEGISLFGYSRSDILKICPRFMDMLHPHDRERVAQELEYFHSHHQDEFLQEYRILTADGETRWVEDHTMVRRDENDKILYAQGILLDQTERKKSELDLRQTYLALQESEEQLRQFIEFLPDPTFAIDRKGRLTIWNRAMEELSGKSAEAMLGKTNKEYSKIFYKESQPMLVDLALKKDEKQQERYYPTILVNGDLLVGEFDLVNFRGGITVWAKAAPLRDASGTVIGAVEVIRDITERVHAEQKLRASRELLEIRVNERTIELNQTNQLLEEKLAALEKMEQAVRNSELRLRNIMDSSSTIIYLYNEKDEFGFINKEFEKAFVITEKDILGKQPGDIFGGFGAALVENNAQVRKEGKPLQFNETLTLPDGEHTYLTTKFPLFDACGEMYGVGGISTDITHREQMARELKETHRRLQAAFDELEAFSYSVSHDLRAPLRRIDGYCQALDEDCQDQIDETGRHYLKRIRSGVAQMSALIDALLQLSRLNKMELNIGRVDLVGLGRAVIHELQQQEPQRAANFYHPDHLIVYGDEKLLRIAVRNLLENAWKFTASRTVAEITLSAQVTDGEIFICVRDNGIGFDPKYADQLFIAFQRLHDPAQYPGTGIGLATVKRILHRHGGMVWAEGKPGEGAAFYFTLPDLPHE